MTWREEGQKYILPLYGRLPLDIVRGEGMYLFDSQGKRYLDFYSGIAVNTLGHGHPEVLAAVEEQMKKYFHLSNYFVTESQVELAKLLVENSFAGKVFFANSGTEANEAMIKLARKYGREISPHKYRFVALNRGFHGRTLGGLSLTANPAYKEQFGELMPGVTHVDLNDAEALERAVDENTCGIIFEVIQGEGGLQGVTPKFVEKIKEVAKKHNALILVDEVQTGLLRTGKLFAYEHLELVPDALTLAKGLGGGLPIGALLVSPRLENVLKPGDHGSTFGGNPVAAAAGAAVMRVLLQPEFQENVWECSNLLRKGLEGLQMKYPEIIREIRGRGLMLGVEVGSHALTIRDFAQEEGLLLNITGKTVLRLLPALILTKVEIEEFLRILDNGIRKIAKGE